MKKTFLTQNAAQQAPMRASGGFFAVHGWTVFSYQHAGFQVRR